MSGSRLWIVDNGIAELHARENGIDFILALRVCLVENFRLERAGVVPRVPGPVDIRVRTRPIELPLQDSADSETLWRLLKRRRDHPSAIKSILETNEIEVLAPIFKNWIDTRPRIEARRTTVAPFRKSN